MTSALATSVFHLRHLLPSAILNHKTTQLAPVHKYMWSCILEGTNFDIYVAKGPLCAWYWSLALPVISRIISASVDHTGFHCSPICLLNSKVAGTFSLSESPAPTSELDGQVSFGKACWGVISESFFYQGSVGSIQVS